ncbi:MAG: DUF4276 family protein [Saprospiraceae bacterium]
MKRLKIICEGQTEREFCNDVLYPHFLQRNISIITPLIEKTNGGIVKWSTLKTEIENHLKQDRGVYVTTLIDLYGIKDSHNFPGWAASNEVVDKPDRMTYLEEQMKSEISPSLRYRFIPYIQLHEFEGILFNNIEVFDNNFELEEILNRNELITTINTHPNPELINDGATTAPSKRLKRLIKGYNKVVYGAMLAKEIGLNNIRAKCSRFDNWINQLEGI